MISYPISWISWEFHPFWRSGQTRGENNKSRYIHLTGKVHVCLRVLTGNYPPLTNNYYWPNMYYFFHSKATKQSLTHEPSLDNGNTAYHPTMTTLIYMSGVRTLFRPSNLHLTMETLLHHPTMMTLIYMSRERTLFLLKMTTVMQQHRRKNTEGTIGMPSWILNGEATCMPVCINHASSVHDKIIIAIFYIPRQLTKVQQLSSYWWTIVMRHSIVALPKQHFLRRSANVHHRHAVLVNQFARKWRKM